MHTPTSNMPGKLQNLLKQLKQQRRYVRLLEIRCRGKLLVTARTDTLPNAIKIGKDEDNDWVIPNTDRIAAAHHAVLELGIHKMTLRALGDNVIYVQGQPVKSHKLNENDRVAMGDCELIVTATDVTTAQPTAFHRLEFLNGPRAGETFDLKNGTTSIGSADDNALVLKDNVVSRKHAEIRVNDHDEVWLHALSGLNGTFVNGKKLGSQDRMLMDMDDVSIAYFDFKFLDRKVYHARSQLLKKMLVMCATLLAIIGIASLFYLVTPRAADLRNAAVFYIQRAEFDMAKRLLDQMPNSRGFEDYKAVYKQHLANIARYRKTLAALHDFQHAIGERQWSDAAQCYGRLELKNRDAWAWNDATVDDRMAEVANAKFLLDQLNEAMHALVNTDSPIENQTIVLAQLEKHMAAHPSQNAPEWMAPLYAELKIAMDALRENIDFPNQFNQKLTLVFQHKMALSSLRRFLADNYLKSTTLSILSQVHDTMQIASLLVPNTEAVAANEEALTALQLDKIKEDIAFITYDKCQSNKQCLAVRTEITAKQRLIVKCAAELKVIHAMLTDAGCLTESRIERVRNFTDAASIDAAFACLDAPRKPSSTPVDAYDRMFGILYFYDIILQSAESHENAYRDTLLDSMPFVPECVAANTFFKAAEMADSWLAVPEYQPFIKGKIKELQQKIAAIMAQRQVLLKRLADMASTAKSKKAQFAAQAAFFYFSPVATIPQKDMDAFAAAWKNYRQTLVDIFESYDRLDAQATRAARDRLVALCLPGDPLLAQVQKND